MRASVWLYGVALGLPVRAAATTASPLANIVKLLEDVQKETKESMDIEEKTLSDFECAKKKTDKHMTAQKEEAEAALKTAQQELDMVLNGATLTDESAVLSAKIQDLDKKIKAVRDEIAAEKAKTEAAVAALNDGITALANAITKLSAESLLQMGSSIHHLITPKAMSTVSPAIKDSMLNAVAVASQKADAEQTPEQYEKQSGTVKKFMTELMLGYKKEIVAEEQDWKKTDAALNAKKETLEQEKSAVQKEAAAGAGELAAKKAKEKELTDTINLSTDLIQQANDEMAEKKLAYETALSEYQKVMKDLEDQMDALTEALKVLTSEEARDKRDALAGASLLQKRSSTVRVGTVRAEATQSVFQVIIGKIDDFVSALETQTDSIQAAIKKCEEESKMALENLRDTAVFYDEEKMKRDNAQDQIDTKTEKVEQLTKKVEDEIANLAEYVKEADEEVSDLTELKGKHTDVKKLIDLAFQKLRVYPDAKSKFKTVFTIFTTEQAKSKSEIDRLNGEIKATEQRKSDEKDRVGVPPSEEGVKKIGSCEDDIAVCASEKNVLCDLRTNIDDLCNGINEENGKKTDAAANMNTASKQLETMMSTFADTQPSCDTPMINGPAQIESNAKEIDELKQAKSVLASYDTMDIGQGANYTDTSAGIAAGPSDASNADWDAAGAAGTANKMTTP